MRAHYLQHVSFEGLGSIEGWLHSKGYEISCTPFYVTADLPGIDEIDLLIVMGGPMSVNDENEYPWLKDEKKFIRSFIESGKPTLGICLGAQLIAKAMGAKIFKNSKKEIGWFPVQAVRASNNTTFKFPEDIKVFHWHGETFSLPADAVLTAESRGCRNQAFQIGNSVIGLQFHLETTAESAKALVSHCREELVDDEYIQKEEFILSAAQNQYNAINLLMSKILEYLHNSGDL